jgi:hypothetical protein
MILPTGVQRKPSSESESSKTSTTRSLSAEFSKACANASDAADAQLSICALKTLRMAVIAVAVITAIVSMTVVAAYGFFLLDACLAHCLSAPTFPGWFSPLIRGLIYTLAPTSGLLYLWHSTVGFSQKTH